MAGLVEAGGGESAATRRQIRSVIRLGSLHQTHAKFEEKNDDRLVLRCFPPENLE